MVGGSTHGVVVGVEEWAVMSLLCEFGHVHSCEVRWDELWSVHLLTTIVLINNSQSTSRPNGKRTFNTISVFIRGLLK